MDILASWGFLKKYILPCLANRGRVRTASTGFEGQHQQYGLGKGPVSQGCSREMPIEPLLLVAWKGVVMLWRAAKHSGT